MQNLQNPMVNELLTLINDGKVVLELKYNSQPMPPKYIEYHCDDGTVHRLDLQLDRDQFIQADKVLRAWWSVIHKLKIQDVQAEAEA